MSHVAVQECKPGEPMFKDMEALQLACQMLGLQMEMRKNYTWFNSHVGDYPLPKGVKVSDLGKNAEFVIRLNDENTKKHGRHGRTPYEIGMLADPNNPGCYVPIYDFYAGGYGLEEVIGRPHFNDKAQQSVKILCPKLKQFYDMACDGLAAKAAGDNIQFMTAKEAHEKYPQMFPQPTADTDTWVSISDTSDRIQTTN